MPKTTHMMKSSTCPWSLLFVFAVAEIFWGCGGEVRTDRLKDAGLDARIDAHIDARVDSSSSSSDSASLDSASLADRLLFDGHLDAQSVQDAETPIDADTETPCSENDVPQPNTGITEPAGVGGCPPGMTPIHETSVCIDMWEAHLVEVLPNDVETPWSPYFNPQGVLVRAKSAPGAVPQGYISGDQASAACIEAGKRLCTQSEWETACRGSSNFIYPYGNTRQPGVCNDARSVHPAVEYFGTSDSWIWSELGHPCINQLEDSLDPTGENTGCLSSDGAYDLMGNLHEWIADANGTFKGGYYVDTVINGEGCLYTTTAHNTMHWDYSTGFRCCADLP